MAEEDFKRQFLPLHPKLYRIAFSLTGNAEDAEDIIQEAYCKLWDKREELTVILNPEAFCVSLVRNMCLDLLRSASHRMARESLEEPAVTDDFSPEATLIDQDRVRVVNRLIEALPENQRQVIRLHGIDGCSPEEIKLITGLSAINIRVLLSRARKTVREKFEKMMSYER